MKLRTDAGFQQMTISPSDELLDLARDAGVNVTPANHLYPPFSEHFEMKCRVRLDGANAVVYAGQSAMYAEIGRGAEIVLALGRADQHLARADEPVGEIEQTPVFAQSDAVERAKLVLAPADVRKAIETLDVRDDEQLVVVENTAIFVWRPGGATVDLSRLQCAADVVALLSSARVVPDPVQLRPIAAVPRADLAFLGRWAITDDAQRELLLSDADEAELRGLDQFLEAHGKALNRALDDIRATDPEAAAEWGAVAETAAEARLELQRRAQL
jgi:hypothetical protein